MNTKTMGVNLQEITRSNLRHVKRKSDIKKGITLFYSFKDLSIGSPKHICFIQLSVIGNNLNFFLLISTTIFSSTVFFLIIM